MRVLPVGTGWRSPRFGLLAALILSLLLTLIFSSHVQAHAGLVRSDPADNAILATSPTELRFWFSEPISPEFSSARLLDVNGQVVHLDGLRIDPDDRTLLIVDPPVLSPGVYSVSWKVLSETDGHVTQGLMVFGIGEGTDLGSSGPAVAPPSVPILEVLLRWLNFALLSAMLGGISVLFLVLGDKKRAHPDTQYMPADRSESLQDGDLTRVSRARILQWISLCAWAAVLVGFGWLAYQYALLLQTVPQGSSFLKVGWQLIGRTRWGALWLVRQIILLGIIGSLAQRGRRWSLPMAGMLAILLMVVQSLSGHASGVKPITSLAVAADTLHLISVSVWIGGVLALVIGTFPFLQRWRGEKLPELQAIWGAFGRWAALSVGVIIATGLYATGVQTASLDAVISTLYGWVLSSKVGLTLLVGAVGLANSMILHPRLAEPLKKLLRKENTWSILPQDRLRILVMVEAGLGLLIFLLAGVLTSAPPARGPEFAPAPEHPIDSLTGSVDDLLVNFSAKPNLPGTNIFTIQEVSERRPPPGDVLRLILHFTYLEQDTGTQSVDAKWIDTGTYQIGGSYLSLPGKWRVDVVVRRGGLEDSVVSFEWNVPAGSGKPVILSNRPWELWLTAAAMIWLVLVLILWLALSDRSHSLTAPSSVE